MIAEADKVYVYANGDIVWLKPRKPPKWRTADVLCLIAYMVSLFALGYAALTVSFKRMGW